MENYFFTACIVILAILNLFCLLRAIIGPKIADRIVAVNMVGTITIIIIAVFSVILNESYLLDICLIYAMISFLSVVVLTRVYMGVYLRHKAMEEGKEDA